MSRACWIAFHAMSVTTMSLVAALVTKNPNWLLNIPLGLISGTLLSAWTWPLYRSVTQKSCYPPREDHQ